ncbi:NADH-quinone oxidoreductase subunit N [Streptomyces sp. TRM43335]|uniref:NADH-quinone oxidoreductase subunit N n=1 Tax=Streptomyces taklimakanensis TaxID=2569853 RepID=A0A6G2BIJ7_9ACTN|nr:NADH-quinone oxidoreductase subunit N [Streptomyces taklimakanensis]MTE22105.1 NADH-quinone oxidoreductase subunit N [Streptomyces taklimakanensis]
MHKEPLALVPEILLLIGAVATLLTGSFLPRGRQWIARAAAGTMLAASLVAAALAAPGADRTVYAGTYALDGATDAARVIVPAAALSVLTLASGRVRGDRRETEFCVLVLLGSLGAVLLAGASDLLLLAVAYLLASIPLYALAGWGRDARGAEAALKLYLLGVLLGITMLLGTAVLYGLGGATDYAALAEGLSGAPRAALAVGTVALLAGPLFKAGAVPAHFWVPDAVSGATVPAAAFLTTVPKIGALVALYRVLTVLPEQVLEWRVLLAAVAVSTMTLGNLAAFAQTDPLRLLGYSTISQAGYLLMALAVAGRADALRSLLLYLAAYAVTNLGAFAVAAALPNLRTLAAYRGLGRHRPWLAAALTVCLLGLVGTPPTAVFMGKLTVFSATWDGGMAWLVAIAALNTLVSLFYYLRWIAPALSIHRPGPPPQGAGPPGGNGEQREVTAAAEPESWAAGTAVAAASATLVLGAGTGWVLGLLSDTLVR